VLIKFSEPVACLLINLKNEFEKVNKGKLNGAPIHEGSFKNTDVEQVQSVTAEIGFANKNENLMVLDFLDSTEIYEIIKSKYYPIMLDDISQDIFQNMENLQNMTFSYRYAFENYLY
jgi:hypothetical protein